MAAIRSTFFLIALCAITACSHRDSSEHNPRPRKFNESIILQSTVNDRREISWNYLKEGKADSAISFSFNLVRKAELENMPDELVVDSYLHLGHILLNAGANDLAEVYLKKAIQLYKGFGFSASGYLRNLYSTLGSSYLTTGKHREALHYYAKAKAIQENLNEPLYVASMLNNMGLVYMRLNHLDSARIYFLEAKDYFEEHRLPFDELVFSISNNLGHVAYLQGNHTSSLKYYRTNHLLAGHLLDSFDDVGQRMVTSNLGLAKNHLAMGYNDSVALEYNEASEYLQKLELRFRMQLMPELIEVRRNLALVQGNLEMYHRLTSQLEEIRDSLKHQQLSVMALATNNMADLQLQVNNLLLKTERAYLKFNQLLTLSLFMIFLFIGGLLVITVRKRTQQLAVQKKLIIVERRNKELEEEKLRLELQHREQDLSELAIQVSLFNNMARQTREKLRELPYKDVEAQKQEIAELSRNYSQHLNSSKVQSLIYQNLQELNTSFYRILDKVCTGKLSKREKELCALFRLQLSDEQIAEVRNVSISAIRVARFRIKKKFQLGTDEDITTFLSNLKAGLEEG